MAQRAGLERSGARASRVAMVCLAASVAVGIGFVVDLSTMGEGECDPPTVNPWWFVLGMIGLALAATIAAVFARSRARALEADTASATVLVWLGFVVLIVMIGGSIIGVIAASIIGRLGYCP